MAGGEYQVDDYYEMIKKQMKKIKSDLNQITNERDLRRAHRHKGGFYLVSIAGYTNSGKSSLLNLLSDEKVKVEGKLFSTLSTTTRKLKKTKHPILITDTVGFIRNLPAWVIDAFHSTLEEIELADVVILVVDASEDQNAVFEKMEVSIQELIDLGVNSQIIIAFNKIDKISQDKIKLLKEYLDNKGILKEKSYVFISVKKNLFIDNLIEKLIGSLPQLIRYNIKIPITNETQSIISWIYDKANVLNINYSNNVEIEIESSVSVREMIISKSKDIELINN